MTVSDFPDFGTPGQNVLGAAQGGVPLLRGTGLLGTATGQVLTSGLSTTLVNQAPVLQPGYEALFAVNLPAAAGSLPFLELIFNWFDSGTGLNVDSEFFVLTAGNGPANQLQYYMSGPVHGDLLSVSAIDLDPIQNMTITWVINQTSHVFEYDKIAQPVYATTAPITFTNPSGIPAAGVLFFSTPTIAANTTTSRLVAVWNGVIDLAMDDNGQSGNLVVTFTDPSGQLTGGIGSDLFVHLVTAGNRDQAEVNLPNGPVLLNMRNTSTTASITPQVSGVKRRY